MDQNMDNQNPGDNDLNEPKPPQAPTPFGAEPSQTPTPEPTPQPDFQAAPEPAAQAAPGATPPPPGESATVMVTKDAAQWGMFCHLAALAGYIGVPFGNILGPLILWLIKKDDFLFVEDQGKEALNFQISLMIYGLCLLPTLCFPPLLILLAIALSIANLVFIIMASVAASKGEAYRYPCCLRLVK